MTTPTCDKCGIEITTGFQFSLCPLADACELWPHDSDQDTERLAWQMWAGHAREAFQQQATELTARINESDHIILLLTADHNSGPTYVKGFERAHEYFARYQKDAA